jgi:hypothetical protein
VRSRGVPGQGTGPQISIPPTKEAHSRACAESADSLQRDLRRIGLSGGLAIGLANDRRFPLAFSFFFDRFVDFDPGLLTVDLLNFLTGFFFLIRVPAGPETSMTMTLNFSRFSAEIISVRIFCISAADCGAPPPSGLADIVLGRRDPNQKTP